MSGQGFAIRCPNCRRWSKFSDSPADVAVRSVAKFNTLVQEFETDAPKRLGKNFRGRVFFCQSPPLLCPAPFEAVIYDGGNPGLEELRVRNSWSLTRHFKLFRDDQQTRWDDPQTGQYCGILFNTRPVKRLRYIALDSLMDRELVSRLIAGICVEIDSPLTIFSAHVFELEDRGRNPEVYWMPIEGYSQEHRLVPPRFSRFCNTCRGFSVSKLSKDFEESGYSPENCPKGYGADGLCVGREPACTREPKDWDHCPAFLEVRKDKCPCYNSDLALTARVGKAVRERTDLTEGIRHQCHAGFHEVAFPIIVHDQLVAVAMTGQVFFRPEQIRAARDFIRSKQVSEISVEWETQKGEEEALEEVRQILIGTELDRRQSGHHTVFLVDESQLKQKVNRLLPNLERLQKSAESHYRDFRARSEFAFRQELLGFMANHKADENFFGEHVRYLLQRMQSFWAFKASYLLSYSCDSRRISLVASSVLGHAKAFGLPGLCEKELNFPRKDFHSCPYLHFRGAEPHSVSAPLNNATKVIESIVDKMNENRLKIGRGDCEFFVVLPTVRGIYTFLFAARDPTEVSGLECLSPGNISNLTQDIVFETCSEVVGEFHNLPVFGRVDMQTQVRRLEKLRKEIAGRVATVGLQLESEIEDIPEDELDKKTIHKIVSDAISDIASASEDSVGQRITEIRPAPRKSRVEPVPRQ